MIIMKIINYETVKLSIESYVNGHTYEKKSLPLLISNHEKDESIDIHLSCIHVQLAHISNTLQSPIEGKRILDLGCGSNTYQIESGDFVDRTFEPWLCRSLNYIGAKPIGVDIGDLTSETFEKIQTNLLNSNCLEIIPDNSIDLAHASQLFTSSFLLLRGISPSKLYDNIIPQLERVLKPDACFIYFQ